MPRVVSAILTGMALAALQISNTWGAAPSAKITHARAVAAKAKKYKGPLVDMRWGPVQATITIKGKKITAVSITTNPDTHRSQFLDDQAVPILKQETLQAQSANIDAVSGATMTSDAYVQSLQSAIKKAHFKTPKN